MSRPMELSVHAAVLRLIEEGTHDLAKEFINSIGDTDTPFRLNEWFKRVLKVLFGRAPFIVTTIANASDRTLWTNFPADIGLIDEGENAVDPEMATIMTNFLSSVRI